MGDIPKGGIKMNFDKINTEITRAHEQSMSNEEMIADIRRQEREMKAESYVRIPIDDFKQMQKSLKELQAFIKASKNYALEVPFSSVRTREREFLYSKKRPDQYYNFRYFGVIITIWRHGEEDYSIATIGWYPKNKRFTWRRGYAGKYAFYNRCNDLETAIVDWLLLIAQFLQNELGINVSKQGELELEPRNGTIGAFEKIE